MPSVYIALQQFCETDNRPLELLNTAGLSLRRNTLGHRLRREEVARELRGAQAVLAGVEPYDSEILQALPELRCISRCGTGTDSIDLEAARHHKIEILTTPDEVVSAVAQLAVTMILSLARNLSCHLHDFRQGRWRKETGHLLSEWTIGLVGLGRIGRATAALLRPFGPTLLATDPQVNAQGVPSGVAMVPLEELLRRSDVVSLHAARKPDAGPLLDKAEIALMKPGARLVNTARGHLVNEVALTEALQSGHLSGAALDVFQVEPYQGPLAQMPQAILTPHISSLTQASRAAMELRCAQNVVNFFAGLNRGCADSERGRFAAR